MENRRWILTHYSETGPINEKDFTLETQLLPELKAGEIRVKLCYISCDPTQIGWSRADTYMPRVALGQVMRAGGYGVVVASKNKKFPVDTRVMGLLGFQEYFQGVPGEFCDPIPPFVKAEDTMGLLGFAGLTAYYVVEEGDLKAGQTMVVSGAAGSVGSLVCQIGKLHGMRVVGMAGTADKCARLVKEWGCDEAVMYKRHDLKEALNKACPRGVDVYFENTSGPCTEAVWPLLNIHARVVVCGMIATYTEGPGLGGEGAGGLPIYNSEIIIKRLKIKGILVLDLKPKFHKAVMDLSRWHRQGKLNYSLDVLEGIENCVKGLQGIFTGDNQGKRVIKVSEPPAPVSMYGYFAKQAAPYLVSLGVVAATAITYYRRFRK